MWVNFGDKLDPQMKVQFVDLTGKLIWTGMVTPHGNRLAFGGLNLAAGVYFLEINTAEGWIRKKVVRE